jgi:hypothetical protein
LSVWRIHRRIGMSGGLLINALLRESGQQLSDQQIERVQRLHAEAYARLSSGMRPLPGARDLLAHLTKARVPWAIATSGRLESAKPALDALGVGADATVITRDEVARAKPDPDLFLAAAERINAPIDTQSSSVTACGLAGGPPGGRAWRRTVIGWIRAGRTGACRSVSRVSGPRGPCSGIWTRWACGIDKSRYFVSL